ncbi:ATP-binding protein [Ruegeria sp. HKCCA5014]|uniref:ATP-binding protein n=1 Tax=Ruegeria sp. HKCCA5014 TaxID=2682980 RepID=UPI0014878F43|nr:ATP-binding protein [Ruegeria sp. HKCCA5014]
MTHQRTGLKEASKRIRALLEEVYDTSKIIDFHELCEQYVSCFDQSFDLLFYIKERKWFVDKTPQRDPFLKFNYLSFETSNGKLNFFSSPASLEEREAELEATGFQREISNRCVILMDRTVSESEDFEPVKNLTRRLFVAFYRNCGSFDHFRQSVSLRFAREMHKSVEDISEEKVADFIRDRLKIKIEIFHQRDEIFFTPEASFSDLVKDVQAVNRLPNALVADPEFNRAFRTSILRKNRTYGKCKLSDIRFAIVTHAEEYFVNNEVVGHRTIKQRPKLCMVCYSEDQHLDLEEIYHATRIVSLFLHYSEVHDRESLMSFYSSRVQELEEKLSENPVDSRGELDTIAVSALLDICEFALRLSDAEGFVFFEYDPVDRSLKERTNGERGSGSYFASMNDALPHVKVFEAGDALDIWHPEKLKQDIEEASRLTIPDQVDKIEISKRWLKDSIALANFGRAEPRSAWIAPIVRGRTPVGVVEFYATSVSRLSPSIPVLRVASELVGELMHRSELANDRGWLAKLSFIQVARHRIENAIAKVHRIDQELAEQLRSSFIERNDENNLGQAEASSNNIVESTKFVVEKSGFKTNLPQEFWDKFFLLRKYDPVSNSVANAIADVLETILSNESHSPFQPERLSVGIASEESTYPILEIIYAPDGVHIPVERAERLCTAPFRRQYSPTYHYGLFLCGTQLRMLGGRAFAAVEPISGSRSSKFILTFQVPLRIWGENNDR